ncbi:MAG: FAD-dependent oxidoreductase [Bauldia litoralis]|uniref:NAD(P)/FAD-dependent oxidoreductase n=2 Tax=Bauldia litoralis TaxID=665467 RepID=UPI0032979DEB
MTTEDRDLRTGRTYWQSRPMPAVPHRPLIRDVKGDVLVVGAGISGALVAEALSDRHRVIVVDKRGPVMGSTPASTALVEYEIDTPLIDLSKQIGRVKAERAWRRSHLALHALAARTRALGIAADTRRTDNLYLAGNLLDAAGIAAEAQARRQAGIETQFLDRRTLADRFGIKRPAALLAFDDLALDPRRLTSGFLNAAIERGTRVYAPTEITDVDSGSDGITATTANGRTIRAGAIVFATGYELPRYVPKRRHRVMSTYAIATVPQKQKPLPEDCFIWEASDPYLYLRSTPDGRVICGGEDEEFSDDEARDALIPEKTEAIRRKLGKMLPHIDTTPDFAWAGAFGSTPTGLPSIGAVPGLKNAWAVLGFGGNGITYSRIAADIINAALAGKSDPDADLYAFAKTRAVR